MAADELGRRVDHDVGAVLDRPDRYGVAIVLSTISGMPASCAIAATAPMSGDVELGLPIVST